MAQKHGVKGKSRQLKLNILCGTWVANKAGTTWATGGDGMTLTNPHDGYWGVTYDESWSGNLGTFAQVSSSSDLNFPDGYATVYDAKSDGAIVVVREQYDDAQPGYVSGTVSFAAMLTDSRWDVT